MKSGEAARRKRTPTTLAPRGRKSRHGVSPSGFTLAEYVSEEVYAQRKDLPRFLNVIPASESPCTGCHAECCRARVVMNVPDLVRLVAPLQMPPSSACDLVECETRNGEPILIGETPKQIVLRKGDDDFCVFLMNVDGHRRCGVHAIRPAICRIYPFSWERGNMRYQMGYVACPSMWVVGEARKNAVLDDVESHEHDRVLDRKLVRRWNARPAEERTPQGFWRFAMVEGAAELGLDVGYLTRPEPRTRLKPALW
ncbi:MAG: YkgJ family cysteine cluster protein [Myxococcota bacterium]